MISKLAVTYIDILGFREKISSTPLPDLASKYEKVIKNVRLLNSPFRTIVDSNPSLFSNLEKGQDWCIQKIFSDSIILFALDESEESFLKLAVYSWRITQVLIAEGMLPRGAISFGEIYINTSSDIFLGSALTEAYELEQKQNWIGISLTSTAYHHYKKVIETVASPSSGKPSFLTHYPVPMKPNNHPVDHVVINWRWNLIVEKGIRSLLPSSKDISVKAKTDNTINYLKHIVQSGSLYPTDSSKTPVELRTFYIGDSEPPFSHGDDL